MSTIRTAASAVLTLTVLFTGLSIGSAVPALAQPVDTFVLGYGDTVSDGSPGSGAGNLETGGAVDVYTFSGSSGDGVILDPLAGATVSYRWRLEGPTGDVVFDSAYVDRALDLSVTGTYSLTVYGSSATTTGTYSFRLLLTPPSEQFAIAFGDTVSDGVPSAGAGNIEAPGALDVYSFEGEAGRTAVLDAISGPTSGLRWILTAPDGTELVNAIFTDAQVVLPETGTYTLTVQGLSVTGIGTYSFQIVQVPPAVDRFAIAFGDTVSDGVPSAGAGNIEAPGALDVYSFEGEAGRTAVLDAISGPTSGLRWILTAPDGTELVNAIFTDAQVVLPETGTYTLTVQGLSVTGIGTYSFQLLDSPANSDPVAVDDVGQTDHDVSMIIDVLVNDTDPDGDALHVVSVTQSAHAVVGIDGTRISYDPEAGFSGSDSFTYTVSDGAGGLAEGTVTITVHPPANLPPVLAPVADQDNTVGEHVRLPLTSSDPDGDPLTHSADGLPPGLTIDSVTGEITGAIEQGAEASSPYAVVVTVADPAGASAAVEFSWDVRPAQGGNLEVEIDILLPCLFVNGFGTIPVVVFGNDQFDAGQIDPATVQLEGMPVQRLWRHYLVAVSDVDDDGTDDLIVLIRDTGAVAHDATSATLTGSLRDGTTFFGTHAACSDTTHL